jgi:arabinofuranosyltransferase
MAGSRPQVRGIRSESGSAAGRAGSTDGLEATLQRHRLAIFLAVAAAALVAAWLVRFVQDDAFISFTYARNLVEGKGLTWFGSRVEGYTNFLWVLWLALGMVLKVEPVLWSWLGGLASLLTLLYSVGRLAELILRRLALALLALLLLIANYSVLAYATGGLETMLQAALLALAALLAFRAHERPSAAGMAGLSLVAALAALTRLDSLLVLAVLVAPLKLEMLRGRPRYRELLALALPFLVLVGVWFVLKTLYYGEPLPNTFAAKVRPGPALLLNGLRYVGRFLHWYSIWPFLGLGLVLALRRRRRLPGGIGLLLVVCGVWWLYLIAVGGDFMEFRGLVPIAGFLFIALAGLTWSGIGALVRPRLASGIVLLVLAGASLLHAVRFRTITGDSALDSIPYLATFYGVYPDRDWSRIGAELGDRLRGTRTSVALHAVGAIPYYSRIPAVDMLGLNDREVARRGIPATPDYPRPGHQRHASLRYLTERRVNLIIGHPTLAPRGLLAGPQARRYLEAWFPMTMGFSRERHEAPVVVIMPVTPEKGLLMWYLTPTAELDSVIAAQGWERLQTDLVLPIPDAD